MLTTALGLRLRDLACRVGSGSKPRWGVAGLTASAGVAGWVEFYLLRRTLNRRIGSTGLDRVLLAKLWVAAGAAACGGWSVRLAIGLRHPIASAMAILAVYGAIYFATTTAWGVDETRSLMGRLLKRK